MLLSLLHRIAMHCKLCLVNHEGRKQSLWGFHNSHLSLYITFVLLIVTHLYCLNKDNKLTLSYLILNQIRNIDTFSSQKVYRPQILDTDISTPDLLIIYDPSHFDLYQLHESKQVVLIGNALKQELAPVCLPRR